MSLGPAEILVILVLALLVFGPKRLPEVGRQVGGALREIRKVQNTVRSEINEVLREPAPTLPPAGRAGSDGESTEPREADDHEVLELPPGAASPATSSGDAGGDSAAADAEADGGDQSVGHDGDGPGAVGR